MYHSYLVSKNKKIPHLVDSPTSLEYSQYEVTQRFWIYYLIASLFHSAFIFCRYDTQRLCKADETTSSKLVHIFCFISKLFLLPSCTSCNYLVFQTGLQINRHKRFQAIGGLDFVYLYLLCSASFFREICLWLRSSLSHVGVNANNEKVYLVCPQRSSLLVQICIYQPDVALQVKCTVINKAEPLLKLPLCV